MPWQRQTGNIPSLELLLQDSPRLRHSHGFVFPRERSGSRLGRACGEDSLEFERVSYGIGNSWDAGVEFREGFLAPGMFFPMFFPLSTPSPFFPRAAVGVGGHQILGIRFFSPKFLACDLQGKNNSWEGGGGCGVTPGAGIASLDHSRSLGAPGSPEPIPSRTEFLREAPGEADWSFLGILAAPG